ncbi:response regulator [Bacillus infantis]|uniref:response regulator n=1 Tax=Bacillus infantis TaxID=324767 RepID=UPI003CE96EA4
MLKVLVVDDEVLERKAVAKMIRSSFNHAEVVGEAANGRIAIEMAVEHEPDIIFMDIKMPGVDGIEAVREIRKIRPETQFIMVSAFDTFEYAKKVMQQGVKQYILKPSSKADITAAFESAAGEIMEERRKREEERSLKENLEKAVSIAQKEWVASLMMNQVQDITFESWGRLLGTEILSGYIMLFSYQPKPGREAPEDRKKEWYSWLKETLTSLPEHQEAMVGPLVDDQVPVLFLCQKPTEKMHFKSKSQSVLDSLLARFSKLFVEAELKAGIGHPYEEAKDLTKSYHESVLALQKLMQLPGRSYLFGEKQGKTAAGSPPPGYNAEKELLEAVRQADVNHVLSAFDRFMVSHAEEARETADIRRSLQELFVLVSRMLYELGIDYRQVPELSDLDDSAVLFEHGKNHLLRIARDVQAWRNSHAKDMLYKAKEYIEAHYAEALTLESAAEHVDLSPFYFSKLFKDRFRMTFIDFVTDVRIRKAKHFLKEGSLSLKEICYSIGYKDPNYFSRVFKKHTGLSPTEYRKES